VLVPASAWVGAQAGCRPSQARCRPAPPWRGYPLALASCRIRARPGWRHDGPGAADFDFELVRAGVDLSSTAARGAARCRNGRAWPEGACRWLRQCPLGTPLGILRRRSSQASATVVPPARRTLHSY